MTPYLQDPDFTLHVGDVMDVLPLLEPGSVDCVITSPPYWGLRDYETGQWAGGDPDCDHIRTVLHRDRDSDRPKGWDGNFRNTSDPRPIGYGDTCGKCGATRQDHQLGLEATPELFVQNMVAVFREVWRVLAPHGTCWINLGDTYAANTAGGQAGNFTNPASRDGVPGHVPNAWQGRTATPVKHPTKPKDLVGIPWRVAFALQADGWYLRSDIIWSKPNPMPESVTDRPTKAHEYVFLLTKQPRYWFDAEAVREPPTDNPGGMAFYARKGLPMPPSPRDPSRKDGDYAFAAPKLAGRNVRSVWEIATQPYPEAHFATYPEELVRRCLLAGCPQWVCRECGKPRERIVEREPSYDHRTTAPTSLADRNDVNSAHDVRHGVLVRTQTLGWSDCGHSNYRPGVVLDPFLGSGTTALVARHHNRRCVGVELSPAYAGLAARRLQQLSLLAEIPA